MRHKLLCMTAKLLNSSINLPLGVSSSCATIQKCNYTRSRIDEETRPEATIMRNQSQFGKTLIVSWLNEENSSYARKSQEETNNHNLRTTLATASFQSYESAPFEKDSAMTMKTTRTHGLQHALDTEATNNILRLKWIEWEHSRVVSKEKSQEVTTIFNYIGTGYGKGVSGP